MRRLSDYWPAILLSGAAFALYVKTLAPTVLAGDGGEFQFVPYLLGVAHPTGYPLYCLLGWAWSHTLPLGDVAYRMNLFSAFWAALAVGLLYPTASALLRRAVPTLTPRTQGLIAALVAALFAVTPTFWSQAIIAEVYSLHVVFVILLFFFLLTLPEHPGSHYPLAIAATLGLSLTHHRTTLLLIPAVVASLWLSNRSAFRHRRLMPKAVLSLILPLALYLYIPLRAPHTAYLRLPLTGGRELVLYDNTLSGFVDFVLGGPFGGSIDLSVDLSARLTMAWELLHHEVGWIAIVLAWVGLMALAGLRPRTDSRGGPWAPLALTGLAFVSTVAFNLVYTIGDIYVLFIPSYLVVLLWLAVGVAVLARVGQRFLRRWRQAGTWIVFPFFLLPIYLGISHYAQVDQSQNAKAHAQWEAILDQPLPPGALLVSNDRDEIMPMWYFQYVDGTRPDLLGIYPLITPVYRDLGHVLDLALSTERPIYLAKEMPGVEVKVEVQDTGPLWQVMGPSAQGEPTYVRNQPLDSSVVLVGYDRSPRSPSPGESLRITLYWEPQRSLPATYHTFVHLLDATGRKVAQSDRQPGGLYYPTTLWQPGERLLDEHSLALPAQASEGVYQALVGMYTLSDNGLPEPLSESIQIGQVGVKRTILQESEAIDHPVGEIFGSQIQLLGLDARPSDGALSILLLWQCVQPPDVNHTVFVHLLAPSGEILAQHDAQPQGGAYPTSIWDEGEVVKDEHLLTLPPGLAPGVYKLRVGLYVPATGERLPTASGEDSAALELRIGE